MKKLAEERETKDQIQRTIELLEENIHKSSSRLSVREEEIDRL